ncbi:MAG: hypothetical protein KF893_22050 [Caldilineaceae bacterium]|nr:hypothetical protein [Caldilineaceae bacterium]
MSKSKDSFLDSLMKGVGKQLGKRRRDVNKAIERFHEENNKDESQAAKPAVSAEVNAEDAKSAEETGETAPDNERTGE